MLSALKVFTAIHQNRWLTREGIVLKPLEYRFWNDDYQMLVLVMPRLDDQLWCGLGDRNEHRRKNQGE